MALHLAPIVEGHGEQQCVDTLLKRIRRERLGTNVDLRVVAPLRKPRGQIIRPDHLGRFVNEAVTELRQQARRDPTPHLLVLILIDSEGACPGKLAGQLLGWARAARSDIDIACVLAHPMWETWFAAAASSLAGVNGLPADLAAPPDPERNEKGKAWLVQQLRAINPHRSYTETVDQPLFSERMDLELCHRHSQSFRKLCKELQARMPPDLGTAGELGGNPAPPPAADPA